MSSRPDILDEIDDIGARLAEAFQRVGDAWAGTATALNDLARHMPRPKPQRRYGKISPERAPELLPVGLRVRHRHLDGMGTVGPEGGGLYRADVSGWLVSVRVAWNDGRTRFARPSDLIPEEWPDE